MTPTEASSLSTAGLAVRALTGLMDDTTALTETLLRWFSGSPARWPLNAELGNLSGQPPPFGEKLLTTGNPDTEHDLGLFRRLKIAAEPHGAGSSVAS